MAQNDSLPPDVLEALKRKNVIEAIKLLRNHTGLGLKEAKDAIDAHQQGKPVSVSVRISGNLPANVMEALQRGDKMEAIKLLRQQTGGELKDVKDAIEGQTSSASFGANGLAPGEVPRSKSAFPWIAVVIGLALIAYFLLRR